MGIIIFKFIYNKRTYRYLTFLILLMAHFNTSPTVRRVYRITPSLKYAPIHLGEYTGAGESITHQHLQAVTKKPDWSLPELTKHLKSIYGFHNQSEESLSEFNQLILKGIELERQWSPTHHIFYHGSLGTKLILLETVLAQAKQQKEFPDLFLLRSPGSTDHLKAFPSSHDYTLQQIQSIYAAKQKLGRFDNDDPLRSDLLSVNTAMLANLREENNEDSISYLGNSRLGPRNLRENIDKCLQSHGITKLPDSLKYFFHGGLGSTIMIFIPKPLAHLAYLSHPFGIPLGLPQGKLLSGHLPIVEVQNLIANHQRIPLDQAATSSEKFPQARILLNPDYFANHSSPIRMELFLWQNPGSMPKLHDGFQDIKTIAKSIHANQLTK